MNALRNGDGDKPGHEAHLMQAVDIALNAAVLVMQNGGHTVAAGHTFSNVLKGCAMEGVSAAWRLDCVSATVDAPGGSSAFVRPVGLIGMNLSRATAAMALSERMATGALSAADFAAELERVRQLPTPYNRWVMIAAAAAAAGFFSQIAGGDWGSLVICLVAGTVGQFFRSMLQANKVAVAPVTLVCGVLSALIAAIGLRLGFSDVGPATLLASVFYMVPGLPLINGFIDVISHKYLMVGTERMLNAAFLFLILAVAIALATTLVM